MMTMKHWWIGAALAVLIAAGSLTYVSRGSASALQDCDDWGNDTADRISVARQLLYPAERQEQSTGSAQGDAQALYDLAQEQANSNAPEEGFKLSGDLVEAFSAGANALGGTTNANPDAQIAFAKSVVYNADLRVAYLLDGC